MSVNVRVHTRVINRGLVTVFVLDLARNGEMQTRISRLGSLSLTCARYYTAQLIDALDYMHSKDVIHRCELFSSEAAIVYEGLTNYVPTTQRFETGKSAVGR